MLNTCEKIKLFLIVGSSSVLGFFSYITLKIYLNRRKYSHIPGPGNNKQLSNFIIYLLIKLLKISKSWVFILNLNTVCLQKKFYYFI